MSRSRSAARAAAGPTWRRRAAPSPRRCPRRSARCASGWSSASRRSALQAGAHEGLAFLAPHVLQVRLLVAVPHLVLLGFLLGARRRSRRSVLAFEAAAHEFLALVALQLLVRGLLVAGGHALLLLFLRFGRRLALALVLGQCGRSGNHEQTRHYPEQSLHLPFSVSG